MTVECVRLSRYANAEVVVHVDPDPNTIMRLLAKSPPSDVDSEAVVLRGHIDHQNHLRLWHGTVCTHYQMWEQQLSEAMALTLTTDCSDRDVAVTLRDGEVEISVTHRRYRDHPVLGAFGRVIGSSISLGLGS